jgi:hypothetical protein
MTVVPAAWRVRVGGAASGDGWGIPALALLVICLGCVVTVWRRLARIARTLRGAGS